jgi:hypothetical protein
MCWIRAFRPTRSSALTRARVDGVTDSSHLGAEARRARRDRRQDREGSGGAANRRSRLIDRVQKVRHAPERQRLE